VTTKTRTSRTHTHRGYSIQRGAYYGTSDDRADRWYIDNQTTTVVDRRGPGYATLAEARVAVDDDLLLRGAW
jgi:hypothetical protein